jgi:4-aminobutyrate aminotransferase
MIGMEFSGVPAGFAGQIANEARDKHDMLLLTTSIYETLRLIPPLNVTKEETADAIERIIKSVEGAVNKI